MSEKKELSLDDLDAVSGGIDIGSHETSGMDEFFPANDPSAFDDFCFSHSSEVSGIVQQAKDMLASGQDVTLHYDGETGQYKLK